MMPYKFANTIITIAAITLVSCSEVNINPSQLAIDEKIASQSEVPDLSHIDASFRSKRLFANMDTCFFGSASTKAASPYEPLEGMLDRKNTRSVLIGARTLIEIPFEHEWSDEIANVSFTYSDAFNQDSVSMIRMSLLDLVDNSNSKHNLFVVTMIPYADFFFDGSSVDYSFLSSLPSFRGILLFSTPGGKYLASWEYLEGEYMELRAVEPSEVKSYRAGANAFITFPQDQVEATRSRYQAQEVSLELILEPAIITESYRDIVTIYGAGGGGLAISSRGSELNTLLDCASNIASESNLRLGHGSGHVKVGNTIGKSVYSHQKLVNGILVKSDSLNRINSFVKLIDTIKGISEFNIILDSLDLSHVVIELTEETKDGSPACTVPTKHTRGVMTWYEVIIEVTDGATNGMILEELFHTYQKSRDPQWKNGDYEFEVKIFNALILEKYNISDCYQNGSISYGVDCKIYNSVPNLTNYYDNPCEETFRNVDSYLGDERYFIEKFPRTQMPFEDRIKHIKNILRDR